MAFFKKLFNRDKQEKQERLDAGMERTRKGVWSKISRAIAGKSKIDEDVLDNLEEAFITSDVGVDTTMRILDRIRQRVERDKYTSSKNLTSICARKSALCWRRTRLIKKLPMHRMGLPCLRRVVRT